MDAAFDPKEVGLECELVDEVTRRREKGVKQADVVDGLVGGINRLYHHAEMDEVVGRVE